MNILFVCTGNHCRSPMAEAYFRHLCIQGGHPDVEIGSAGVNALKGHPANDQAHLALSDEGIVMDDFSGRDYTSELAKQADRIYVMSEVHRERIIRVTPDAEEKTFLLMELTGDDCDVMDPLGGDTDEYRECLEMMKPALQALYDELFTNGDTTQS